MPFSKYSPKQKKLARIAEPRDAITGADFAALKKKPKKMAGGGKLSSKKRYGNAIKRKVADIQKRTSGISGSKQAELSGDMFDLDRASVTLKDVLKKQNKAQKRGNSILGTKDFDEQEFKVQEIPTPKI
jgi:hypothetical protein